MRRIPKDITPPGGWYYTEGKLIIKDETFDKLVLSLVAHRINNGKPLGHPSEEIEDQIINRAKKNVNVP